MIEEDEPPGQCRPRHHAAAARAEKKRASSGGSRRFGGEAAARPGEPGEGRGIMEVLGERLLRLAQLLLAVALPVAAAVGSCRVAA